MKHQVPSGRPICTPTQVPSGRHIGNLPSGRHIGSILILIITQLLTATITQAQTDTLRIQTSAVCGTCKETLEHDLAFVKGIVSSNLVVKTKELTVVYDSKKIDAEKIRIEVTKIGYDADSLKADPKAFKRLPECCKKPHNE